MEIIITDLTRFRPGNSNVCIAGVGKDGAVIRPMPYLTTKRCRKLDIHPGGILEGEFKSRNAAAPHVEDSSYWNLKFRGACSGAAFRDALERTLFPDMSSGFGVQIEARQKCIPIAAPAVRSLITIRVDPLSFSLVQDSFHPERIKAHFSDNAGTELSFVSVTDRGFYDYAQQHRDDPHAFHRIKRFVRNQQELYLRLGLSRAFQAKDGRHGYWIQLNGIYTFPDKLEYIRRYD